MPHWVASCGSSSRLTLGSPSSLRGPGMGVFIFQLGQSRSRELLYFRTPIANPEEDQCHLTKKPTKDRKLAPEHRVDCIRALKQKLVQELQQLLDVFDFATDVR